MRPPDAIEQWKYIDLPLSGLQRKPSYNCIAQFDAKSG